jgi:hypothetical protein
LWLVFQGAQGEAFGDGGEIFVARSLFAPEVREKKLCFGVETSQNHSEFLPRPERSNGQPFVGTTPEMMEVVKRYRGERIL